MKINNRYILILVLAVSLISCKVRVSSDELDQYVESQLRNKNFSRAISFFPALDSLKTFSAEEVSSYNGLFLTGWDERTYISNHDLSLVADNYQNICYLKLRTEKRSFKDNLKLSAFKKLRFFESSFFTQQDINELFKCSELLGFALSRDQTYHSYYPEKIDSFSFQSCEKLEYLYLDVTRREFHIQDRPDLYVLDAYDSTSSFYNPNFKYKRLGRTSIWIPAFPEGFGKLPLKELRMSGNKTNSLQNCVGDLKQLEELILTGNNYDAGLENIGRIKTLKRLVLDLGGSTGELPDDVFKDLQNLEELIITWEYLVKLPSSIGLLTNLKSLKIMFCENLTTIPASVEASFNNIDYVKIKGNKYLKDRIIDNRKK